MSFKGKKHTLETRRKISESMRGKRCGKENPMWGKDFSREHRRKISEALTGRKRSPEHCRNLSESLQGRKHTPETRRKMSEAHRGQTLSTETRQKISKAMKGRKLSLEHRQKISATLRNGKAPNLGKRGKDAPSWKGGRIRTGQGYILVYNCDHPHASKRRYVPEHRLVMEKSLGRYLEPYEIVHHINGIKDDNRSENLELVVQRNHRGELRCPHCRRIFNVQ